MSFQSIQILFLCEWCNSRSSLRWTKKKMLSIESKIDEHDDQNEWMKKREYTRILHEKKTYIFYWRPSWFADLMIIYSIFRISTRLIALFDKLIDFRRLPLLRRNDTSVRNDLLWLETLYAYLNVQCVKKELLIDFIGINIYP